MRGILVTTAALACMLALAGCPDPSDDVGSAQPEADGALPAYAEERRDGVLCP